MSRRSMLDAVRGSRFELVVLLIPLTRAVLAPFGLVPVQFEESQVAPLVRAAAIALLGVGAAVAILGVVRQWPIIERAGLHLLAPLSVAYLVVLVAADWRSALGSAVAYLLIAAAAADRSVEITRSMRLVNRWLEDRA